MVGFSLPNLEVCYFVLVPNIALGAQVGHRLDLGENSREQQPGICIGAVVEVAGTIIPG